MSPCANDSRYPSYVVQKLGGKVGAISPLDSVASEAILDELVTVEK